MVAVAALVIVLSALVAWVIWRGIAAARAQGAESTMGVPGVDLRTTPSAVAPGWGPGAEAAVAEPSSRPDPHAQWDEVHGAWVVWHPVLARWVPWEADVESGPPPASAPPPVSAQRPATDDGPEPDPGG